MTMPVWTYDPTTPAATVIITCYKKALSLPSQRYRWRAQSGNNRKLASPGEGYSSLAGLYRNLEVLWPTDTTRHVVVKGP